MSTSAIGSPSAPPMKIQGLGSGLKTEEIVAELMSIERKPVTRLQEEQALQSNQESALRNIQSSLQSLGFSAGELGSAALFQTSQSVTSSEPSRIGPSISGSGAAIGGYELEVSQLASAAQRTFTFKSPGAADTISIDGHEIKLAAGASIAELVSAINSSSEASVYAAATNGETVVLSNRATGSGAKFIEVSDPGGTLTEQAGTAREGRNAEFKLDGAANNSASNTLTEAIPGVTLTLNALTTAGPVTIDVAPPTAETAKIKAQVQAFVKQYNSTLEAIEREVGAKPPAGLQARAEQKSGTLFGDVELTGLLASMRKAIYTPIAGLEAQMSSLASIGVNAGAATEANPSQSAIEGKLTIEESQLEAAIRTDPAGVQKMLQQWSSSFASTLNAYAEPASGTLAGRIGGNQSEVSYIGHQITDLDEALAVHQQSLEARYLALEAAMSKISAQSSWLSHQLASLPGFASGASAGSSPLG